MILCDWFPEPKIGFYSLFMHLLYTNYYSLTAQKNVLSNRRNFTLTDLVWHLTCVQTLLCPHALNLMLKQRPSAHACLYQLLFNLNGSTRLVYILKSLFKEKYRWELSSTENIVPWRLTTVVGSTIMFWFNWEIFPLVTACCRWFWTEDIVTSEPLVDDGG